LATAHKVIVLKKKNERQNKTDKTALHPEVEHGDGVVGDAGRQPIPLLVPRHLENASSSAVALHQTSILRRRKNESVNVIHKKSRQERWTAHLDGPYVKPLVKGS